MSEIIGKKISGALLKALVSPEAPPVCGEQVTTAFSRASRMRVRVAASGTLDRSESDGESTSASEPRTAAATEDAGALASGAGVSDCVFSAADARGLGDTRVLIGAMTVTSPSTVRTLMRPAQPAPVLRRGAGATMRSSLHSHEEWMFSTVGVRSRERRGRMI